MANEIKVLAQLEAQKGTFLLPRHGVENFQFDMAGIGGGSPGLINVGSSPQQLDLSELTAAGWVWMKNIDPSQDVWWAFSEAGLGTGGILRPGRPAVFEITESTPLWMQVDPDTEESESTSAENQAKVHVVVLEK